MITEDIEVMYPTFWYTPKFLLGTHYRSMQLSLRRTLRRTLKEFKPDLVFGSWAYPDGAVAVDVATKINVPSVVQVLGSDVNLLTQHPQKQTRTLNSLRNATRVLAVSDALQRLLWRYGVNEDRTRVVYRGVNADLFKPIGQLEARSSLALPTTSRLLLFVGNLLPVKGPDLLIEAFRQCSVDEATELHVLGDGPLRGSLERASTKLGKRKQVIFHGTVAHDQLAKWMNAADALVLPSRAEGVPNVLLEARSCGCPYIATDVGGIMEVSDHELATIVDAASIPALAKAIGSVKRKAASYSVDPWYSWEDAGAALAEELEYACYSYHSRGRGG